MQLYWRMFQDPLVSDVPLYDFDPARVNLTAASFQTLATAGFGPGTLTMGPDTNGEGGVPKSLIYTALNNWMLKRVTATDGAGLTAYEGYIAEIHATIGNYTYDLVVDDFATRVHVKWTENDPLHPGAQRDNSAYVDDLVNQAKYAIKEIDLDLTTSSKGAMGVINRTQALQAGTTYLDELNSPLMPHFSLVTNQRGNTLNLVLWGYYTTLGFQQDNTKFAMAKEIKTIVSTVLAGGHNQFISTSTVNLDTTGTSIVYNSNGSWKQVDEYLKDVCHYGSPTSLRILLQIWEDRLPYLKVRPITMSYYTRSDDHRLWTGAHAAMVPWRIRAGQYMAAEDFPAPIDIFADAASDPRSYMIEQTNYNDIDGTWEAIPAKRANTDLFLGRVRRNLKLLRVG